MLKVENLLRNEYFPSELPPCFGSESFSEIHTELIEHLEKCLKPTTSEPLIFSGYKNEVSRRKFAIPNPYHYAKIAILLANNSDEIFNHFNKNVSLTAPIKGVPAYNEPYKKNTNNIAETKSEITKLYQHKQFEIRLDIQSFFDSIYTHSIPWAMHSKVVSKKNKNNMTLLGNQLDKALQNMNSNQTNGILTGNAISRIVSEILLCTIDKGIKSRSKEISYKRYVDDYYIFVDNGTQIKEVLSIFQQELSKYELSLNSTKIQMFESPFSYGKPWISNLKPLQNKKAILIIEKAIEEYRIYKDISIFRYAFTIIKNMINDDEELESIMDYILNIWVKFPTLSNQVTLILKNYKQKLPKNKMKKCIYSIFDNHIYLENSEEIIWGVWMCKVFDITINQDYIKKILKSENWLAIIILLDILGMHKSKQGNRKILDEYRESLKSEYFANSQSITESMYSSIWLLAYEIDRNKWLNMGGNKNFDYARRDAFFSLLISKDVSFYNPNYEYEPIPLRKIQNKYFSKREIKLIHDLIKKESSNDNIESKNNIVDIEKILTELLDQTNLY